MADKDPMHDLVTAYLTAQGKIDAGITVDQILPRPMNGAWDVKLDLGGYESAYVSIYNSELLAWLWSHVATLIPNIKQ
jgi:hypothetical protein